MLRVGGSYPWRLDEGYTTVLHLKNTIDKSVYALVQVRYAGGSYNLERLPLQPFQTIAVDLRALRDGQQPDIRGGVMPTDSEGGQVVWYEETIGSLIGRAEVMNPPAAVASSFSCGDTCPCPPASGSGYLTPGSSVGPMGGTAQFTAMEQRQDCRGTIFGPYNRTADSTWSSSNPSVFTVSGGMVSCLQPGSGTVTAQFQGTVYGQYCAPIFITQRPTGSVQVFDFFVTFNNNVLNPTGTGGTISTTVTVHTTPQAANQRLTLFLFEVVGAGGHISHSGARPMGSLAATQGRTNAAGTFQTTYSAPAFGGEVAVVARFGTSDRGQPVSVMVPGLASLDAGTNYNLVGATATHPDNHYGTSAALSNLPLIANDYQAQFYGQNPIPDAEKLRYNDMSLVSGGKFDLLNNWCTSCSHAEHTVGINCDVSQSNVSTARRASLEGMFRARSSPSFFNEGDHWHLRFQ